MARLCKVYIAYFHDKNTKHAFQTEKVLAHNYDHATELAMEWGTEKFNGRLRSVRIERGKGEVIADD
jgi:hypothetical protein